MPPSLHLVTDTPDGPWSLSDPATFVEHARLNGFTPAQAAAVYHQRRLFSGWRWHDFRCWPENTASLVQTIEQVNQVLDTVRTPADWATYADQVRALMSATPAVHPTLSVWPCLLRTVGVDYQGGNDPRDCHSFEEMMKGESTAWQDHAPWPFLVPETEWTWAHVALTVNATRIQVKEVPPLPAHWTLAKATHWLNWLCGQLGLASLTLPWACSTPQDMWNVGVMLRRREMSLRAITGWEGPLLGLAGKLCLHVGQCPLYAGRVAAGHPLAPITMVIGERPEVVFEHEWAHALDASLWEGVHPPMGLMLMRPRKYLSHHWPNLNAHIRALYTQRHAEPEVAADWRAFCEGILPAFQASLAYQCATPEQQRCLTANLTTALSQRWTRSQVLSALEPHVEPTLARFELWLAWMQLNAEAPSVALAMPAQSFPEQVYTMIERPEWARSQNPETDGWWRSAIEHWARFVEICVESPDPDYLHDPLRLPTWRPWVQRVVKDLMGQLHPVWQRQLLRWQAVRVQSHEFTPFWAEAARPLHPRL